MLPKSFCDQRYSRVHRNKSKALHMTKVAKLLPIYLSVLNNIFLQTFYKYRSTILNGSFDNIVAKISVLKSLLRL